MVERLGLPSKDAARELWRPHFATHNQSLKALRAAGFVVDSDEYWAYTRGDASTHLGANDDAIAFFESLMTRRGEEEEEEEEEEEGGVRTRGESAETDGGEGCGGSRARTCSRTATRNKARRRWPCSGCPGTSIASTAPGTWATTSPSRRSRRVLLYTGPRTTPFAW